MQAQGHEEETGKAKITGGYNLPAKHVIHTVGPIVQWHVTKKDRNLLASCYRSCLELAEENKLQSIAFCCISTGVFHYPHEDAAETAVRTVQQYLGEHPDTTIDKQLRENLKKTAGDAAIIMVAQRISTILNADQILVIEKGEVIGKGTHAELLRTCPAYKEMAVLQLGEDAVSRMMKEEGARA